MCSARFHYLSSRGGGKSKCTRCAAALPISPARDSERQILGQTGELRISLPLNAVSTLYILRRTSFSVSTESCVPFISYALCVPCPVHVDISYRWLRRHVSSPPCDVTLGCYLLAQGSTCSPSPPVAVISYPLPQHRAVSKQHVRRRIRSTFGFEVVLLSLSFLWCN